MLESMTGCSKIEHRSGTETISVEITSENNRFLDLSFNLPENFDMHVEEFKRLIAENLRRGRVRVSIRINGSSSLPDINLNSEALKKYYRSLRELATELNLDEPVRLHDLLTYPEIFCPGTTSTRVEELLIQIKDLLKKAVAELVAMRRREGAFLAKEIQGYLQLILDQSMAVEEISRQSRQEYFEKYRQNIAELCQNNHLDENRLVQEAGILAKKLDITEECARLRSHVQQFIHLLESSEPVGKKMNFLIQEMNREITTAGSKSENAVIAHYVVSLKDELEKIREQIQNII